MRYTILVFCILLTACEMYPHQRVNITYAIDGTAKIAEANIEQDGLNLHIVSAILPWRKIDAVATPCKISFSAKANGVGSILISIYSQGKLIAVSNASIAIILQ